MPRLPVGCCTAFALMLSACATGNALQAHGDTHFRIEPQASGVGVRLRGVSAASDRIAWASGQQGTVLRTLDGGVHWQRLQVPGAEALDFRDIEAFDADTAVVLSIGPGAASRVYRTADGGRTWTLALQNADERAFFDCMAFDGADGWMLGDPVEERYQLFHTHDAGRHWTPDPDGAPAMAGEAAFAASGSCIARLRGHVAIGSGGSAARLHLRNDDGATWIALDSGMGRGKPEAGVFSIAMLDGGALVVGGDYKAERQPGNAAQLVAGRVRVLPAPRGYRSGVACMRDALPCVAVGPGGVDAWNGRAWQPLAENGYDAIDFAGDSGWASGADGRIARITRAARAR